MASLTNTKNLQFGHHQERENSTGQDCKTIRGQVDDILSKKSLIELENIFENIEGERKVILIDGAPGSGN